MLGVCWHRTYLAHISTAACIKVQNTSVAVGEDIRRSSDTALLLHKSLHLNRVAVQFFCKQLKVSR